MIYPEPGTKSIDSDVRFGCFTPLHETEIRDECNINGDASAPVVALAGDSHAGQWRTLVYRAAIENGWTLRFYLKAGAHSARSNWTPPVSVDRLAYRRPSPPILPTF